MGVFINLAGKKFGRLTAQHRCNFEYKREAIWLCKCDCGNTAEVTSQHLRAGHTRSCGCLLREITIHRNTTHGLSKVLAYSSWKYMHDRCHNVNNKSYIDYGGRGIKICKRWEKFENFYADMGERPKGMTLDRRNNGKGYCKSNCRWASHQTQANNKRNNHLITFKGKAQTMAQWSRTVDISYSTLRSRINIYKWPVERALTEPINKT